MPGILTAEPYMDEKFFENLNPSNPSNNPNPCPFGPKFSENFQTLVIRDTPLLREITEELLQKP